MQIVYLFSSVLLTAALAHENGKVAYPFRLFNGTSSVEEISQQDQMDAPKIMPHVNATTFEWWYFDAVSTTSQNESLTVMFENMGPEGLGAPYPGGPLAVQISGSFSNGTAFTIITAATKGAVLEWGGGGVRGEWRGAGSSFAGKDHREYTVSIANPGIGVYGTMTLRSVSPPRYPCDVKERRASEQLIPNMYLANSQPDAIVEVDFNINESTLKFSGIGYHDLSWGSAPLESSVHSWYWGHGRLGRYSLVWFDVMGRDGKEYFSAWITEAGNVILCGCEPDSVLVRPWGENSGFPPGRGTPAPSGYSLRYDLGQNQIFIANFTREVNIIDNDFTKHIIGLFSGGFEGGEQYEGRAMADQFQFGDL